MLTTRGLEKVKTTTLTRGSKIKRVLTQGSRIMTTYQLGVEKIKTRTLIRGSRTCQLGVEKIKTTSTRGSRK